MHKKITRRAFCSMLLALPFPARAQQLKKVPRIGILISASASFFSVPLEAFRQRLRELGYVEGKPLSLSTDMPKGNSNGCLTLQPNWSVSKLTSWSPPVQLLQLLRKRSRQFPSYSLIMPIQ